MGLQQSYVRNIATVLASNEPTSLDVLESDLSVTAWRLEGLALEQVQRMTSMMGFDEARIQEVRVAH